MQLFHHTGLTQALNIIRSGRFVPASTFPRNADNGLNCYDARGGYRRNIHEDDGVILVLEWRGDPQQSVGANFPPPYEAGVLLDMHPWRMFVTAPLRDQKSLRVSHLVFPSEEVRSLLFCRGNRRKLPVALKKLSRERRLRLNFLRELRSAYRSKDCWLSIY